MIRHRLLCLGYFDFGSVGLFNLGFLSLFAAYAQQSQNTAADVQSSQPTDVVAAVTGLRTLGGVVISWLIGAIITAACIVGVAAVGELVDDRILAALGTANVAFLVLDAGCLLGSGLVDLPLEAVWCRVGLVAALALMPVVGAVILPLCTVAVGMIAACCRDRCGFKNLLADGAFLMLSAVGGFGSCRVNDPLAGTVSRNIGLIAALALMPVIGVVILPLGAVAVGMASSFTSLPGMVKVVVALVASARVTLPSSTTHLSKTLPTSGASAVTVTTVFCAILSVMSVPAARDAVPLMTVTMYPVAAEFFTNLVSPQSARWQV